MAILLYCYNKQLVPQFTGLLYESVNPAPDPAAYP